MRITLLLGSFWLSLNLLWGQTAETPLFYQITSKEYSELQEDKKLDSTFLHTQMDTSVQKIEYDQYGYFIKVFPKLEDLHFEFITNISFSIIVLNNHKDFALRVIDSMGISLANAQVYWEGKLIPYHQKTAAYRLKNWTKKRGRIKIWAAGEVVYYDVTQKDNWYYQKKNLGYHLKAPIRWVRNGWWKLRTWVEEGGFWAPYDRTYKGYIAFNQPKYRPNDTLKVKAFLANKRGKPLKKALELNISSGKGQFKQMIEPERAGVYLAEVVLHDSLNFELDRSCQVWFYDQRPSDYYTVKSHSFYFEDYQLDEVTYNLKTEKKTYEYGEKIRIQADGKFKTGQYIPDGSVRLILQSNYTNQYLTENDFFAKKVLVKDTIWQIEQDLSSQKITEILIPKDSLPKAELTYYLKGIFYNSNGETQQKSCTFNVQKPDTSVLQLTLDGAFIVASLKDTINPQKTNVEWTTYNDEIDLEGVKIVTLPYREKVNGNLTDYDITIENGKDYQALFLEDHPDLVQISGQYQGKKLSVIVENPRLLAINYQLYKGKKLIEEGVIQQDKLTLDYKAADNKTYYLKYQYVWAGVQKTNSESFIYFDKQLDIAIDQPETIIPGEKVPIKIQVKNHKGKRAAGVDLTAGAINGQFEDKNNFSEINIPYKISKSPKVRQEFEAESSDVPKAKAWTMTKDWAIKTKVDSQLFYQLRFPKSGIYLRYDSIQKDSFYQNFAQFAPYLIKEGKAQPIYMIYCNRKLVYYYDVDDNPPYAFIGEIGYNDLQIRTQEHLYHLDSVLLKKGQKLELALDIDRYKNAALPFSVRKENTVGLLTPFEQAVLKKTVFILRPEKGKHFLSQDEHNIHIFSTNNSRSRSPFLKIAPFYPNGNLHYILQDKFSNIFKFESGFSYQISQNRERLYEYDLFKNKHKLPSLLPLQIPGKTVYSPADVQLFAPKKKEGLSFQNLSNKKLISKSIFQFKTHLKKDSLLAIIWQSTDSTTYILNPSNRKIIDNAGIYQFTLVKKDSSYLTKKVVLSPNDLLFLDISHHSFRRDSSQAILQQLKQINPIPKEEIEEVSTIMRGQSTIQEMPPLLPDGPTRIIQGTLTDNSGEPLIGVSAIIKGTTIGTVTDIDGNYLLEVPYGEYELEFSYTDYATQINFVSSNTSVLDIVLSEGVQLDEVVVTGYGIKKEKKNLAVSQVAIRGLAGKVAGVKIAASKNLGKAEKNLATLPKGIQLRINFQDYAFWQPNLLTDQDGIAYFTATFPDNLTQWQTFVIGMDKKQRAGVAYAQTNAFKPLVAQLAVPRFLIEGDTSEVIGKSINFTDDSLTISTLFKKKDEIIQTNTAKISDLLIERTTVIPATKQDTVQLTYQLKNAGYGDGEQRKIPVFKKGIIENKGVFHLLDSDTTIQLDFADKNSPITLRVEGNIYDLLSQDVDYLINYPHGCNEQTASKLMATLLGKKLKLLQQKRFKKEKFIRKGIKRLEDSQNVDGSWGWWKNGPTNIWMTTYVLKALQQAKTDGYYNAASEKGLTYLTNNLQELNGQALLDVLTLFTNINQNTDFEKWLTKVDTSLVNKNLHQKLTILKIQQANNLPHALDTLFKYQQQDIFGNVYWGESNYHWYNTDIQNSLLAYEILEKADSTHLCRSIERYLLRKKDLNGWTNTFQTAQTLTTILGHHFSKNKIGQKKHQLIIKQDSTQIIEQFPYKSTLSAKAPIAIAQKGNQPIYVTAYQTFFNQNPTKKTDIFEVKTILQQADTTVKTLTTTLSTQLIVTVTTTRKAEYVMIEVPIPAGCSYGKKEQNPQSWWRISSPNKEVHREYHKEKVNIFCESLPEGTYTYKINLTPRFTGTYTLNPTKAEEMYFPVFYGRNEKQSVRVEEKIE